MGDNEHIAVARSGLQAVNEWRHAHPHSALELGEADLSHLDLRPPDSLLVDDNREYLLDPAVVGSLVHADLSGCDLRRSVLRRADLTMVDLSGADLSGADLRSANLTAANLERANLNEALLMGATIAEATLRNADLSLSYCFKTRFIGCDLSLVSGLDSVTHTGYSFVDLETLLRSKGQIPEPFLRGVGLPSEFVQVLDDLRRRGEANKVFVSYKHESQEHEQWVENLARDLFARGVYALLDKWELDLGDDLLQYMEQGLLGADIGLFVCSPRAVEDANQRDSGIGYEARIMASLGQRRQIRLIPILRLGEEVPTFLEGRLYMDFRRDQEYEKNLETLVGVLLARNRAKDRRPDLGRRSPNPE